MNQKMEDSLKKKRIKMRLEKQKKQKMKENTKTDVSWYHAMIVWPTP